MLTTLLGNTENKAETGANIPSYVSKEKYRRSVTKIDGTSNGFEYVVSDENKSECFIVGYAGKDKNVNIPEKLNNRKVVAITGITFKIIRGKYVNEYFQGAFEEMNLTSVTIPEGVRIIGDSAFWQNKLTSIVIPKSVTSIGKVAFRGILSAYPYELTNITISENINSIEGNSFPYIFAEVYEFTGRLGGNYSFRNNQWYRNEELLVTPAKIIYYPETYKSFSVDNVRKMGDVFINNETIAAYVLPGQHTIMTFYYKPPITTERRIGSIIEVTTYGYTIQDWISCRHLFESGVTYVLSALTSDRFVEKLTVEVAP